MMSSEAESQSVDSPGEGAHHGNGHIVPYRILIGAAGALMVLTVITVAVSYVNLGELNIWVALAIAAAKASVVALVFMHLMWDRPFNGLILVGSIAFVLLFIALVLTDKGRYQRDLQPGPAPAVQSLEQEQGGS